MSYASERYFENLQADLEQLGLLWSHQPISDIHHLVDALESTTNICSRTAKKDFKAITPLGTMILSWQLDGDPITFNPKVNGIGVCPEAEPKFIANAECASNDCLRSPIIIIDDDKPVALAKSYGEATIYSFETRKEFGLTQDSICYNDAIGRRIEKLPRRSGAYLLHLNDIPQAFEPLRISCLAVPGHYRSQLSDSEGYWIDHDRTLPLDMTNVQLKDTCIELMNSTDAQMLHMNECGGLKPVNRTAAAKVLV